jgi:hypothetical protein
MSFENFNTTLMLVGSHARRGHAGASRGEFAADGGLSCAGVDDDAGVEVIQCSNHLTP